jgi:CBS domain-containing protein
MRPLNELHTVKPDTPLVSALETMSADHVNQLPVVREGRLAGVISRKHILQMLRMRGELQI